jgi:hypothetical protein
MIRKEARTPPGFLFVIFLNLIGRRDIFYKPSGEKVPPAIRPAESAFTGLKEKIFGCPSRCLVRFASKIRFELGGSI